MAEQQRINYPEIIERYPWILKKDQNCILSPDSDGLLCGLLFANALSWNVAGYYDGKVLVLKKGLRASNCVFLDVDIFRSEVRSVGHHMVLYNKNRVPPNWDNYNNCIQPNNLRNFDANRDFQRKYPFGTVHLLLGLLWSQGIVTSLAANAIWPLLFCDGVWCNLFDYTENCLDWLNFLGIPDPAHILHPIFCGNQTAFEVMNGINRFLRMRDSFNATEQFINGAIVPGRRRRTGDKLRLSNPAGTPVNLVQNGNAFDIHQAEAERIAGFIGQSADRTGWSYNPADWPWDGFRLYRFTKTDFKRQGMRLNAGTFASVVTQNPLSWAITSGANMEYTEEQPDKIS